MKASAGSEHPSGQIEIAVDGRRARRERGRLAVIDAKIDLVFEGVDSPSAEQLAERAGVSVASVFRYFDTLDDLGVAVGKRYFARTDHLLQIPNIGEGTVEEKISNLISSRLVLFETTAPMCRLARLRAYTNEEARRNLERARSTRLDQIAHHFDAELRELTPAVRYDTTMAIAITTAFSVWDQMSTTHERTPSQIRRAWKMSITKLLTPST